MNSMYRHPLLKKRTARTFQGIILFFLLLCLCAPRSYAEDAFYSIALSKFSNEQDAKKETLKLKNAGNNAFYRKEKNPDNNSIIYQVYIEKYSSLDEAEKEAEVLKDLELISGYTIKKVPEKPQTVKEEEAPSETGEPEVLPIPQPAEAAKPSSVSEAKDKEQTPEPKAGTEKQLQETGQPPEANQPEPETGDTENKISEPAPETGEQTKGAEQPAEKNEPVHETGKTGNMAAAPEAKIEEHIKETEQPPVENEPAHETAEIENRASEPKAEKQTEEIVQSPAVSHSGSEMKNANPEHEAIGGNDHFTGASLQVGAFKDEANAEATKIQLKNLGKNAFYRHESVDGEGAFYRLYITGYKSLRDAIKDAKSLVASGVISGYSRVHSKGALTDLHESGKVEKESGGKVYFIHISSNKNKSNAEEAVARLKKLGYDAFYVLEKGPSETWYRVYIGKFRSEAEARDTGMELLDKGIISYFKPIVIDPGKLEN